MIFEEKLMNESLVGRNGSTEGLGSLLNAGCAVETLLVVLMNRASICWRLRSIGVINLSSLINFTLAKQKTK